MVNIDKRESYSLLCMQNIKKRISTIWASELTTNLVPSRFIDMGHRPTNAEHHSRPARAPLIDSPGPLPPSPFPFSVSHPSGFLHWWRRLGERRRHSPSPLPATSIHQVCPPLLFPSGCAGRSTPNPNKTICIRI